MSPDQTGVAADVTDRPDVELSLTVVRYANTDCCSLLSVSPTTESAVHR